LPEEDHKATLRRSASVVAPLALSGPSREMTERNNPDPAGFSCLVFAFRASIFFDRSDTLQAPMKGA